MNDNNSSSLPFVNSGYTGYRRAHDLQTTTVTEIEPAVYGYKMTEEDYALGWKKCFKCYWLTKHRFCPNCGTKTRNKCRSGVSKKRRLERLRRY